MKASLSRWYDRIFATVYDPLLARTEKETLAPLRSRLLDGIRGTILDIGSGTGSNLPFLDRPGNRTIFLDRSPAMMRKGMEKGLGARGLPVIGSASALPFADGSFDAIVVTLVLCSVDDPMASLLEIRRTLKRNGTLFLMEHVLSDSPPVASLQKMATPVWKVLAAGCHLDRRTDHQVRRLFREERGNREIIGGLPFHIGVYRKKLESLPIEENRG